MTLMPTVASSTVGPCSFAFMTRRESQVEHLESLPDSSTRILLVVKSFGAALKVLQQQFV
jgi:hypothetical protein